MGVNINHGNSGGPLFSMNAAVIGITTFGDGYGSGQGGPGISGVVRIDEARPLLLEAGKSSIVTTTAYRYIAASRTDTAIPVRRAEDGFTDSRRSKRATSTRWALVTSISAFITPMVTYGVRYAEDQANLRERSKRNSKITATPETMRSCSSSVQKLGGGRSVRYEPTVMLRAKPKLAETFMSALGRGLATSQGTYGGPARLHFKDGLSPKMRVFCREAEVTPIHPFKSGATRRRK